MAFFLIICTILIIGPFTTNAAPAQNNPFQNAVLKKCNNTEVLSKQKEIFENCKNFDETNKTRTNLSDTQMLCLLYFNKLSAYCELNPSKLEFPTLKEIIHDDNDIENICKNMENSFLPQILPNTTKPKYACFTLCIERKGSYIRAECLLADFYNTAIHNITVKSSLLLTNKKSSTSGESASLKAGSSAVGIVVKQNETAAGSDTKNHNATKTAPINNTSDVPTKSELSIPGAMPVSNVDDKDKTQVQVNSKQSAITGDIGSAPGASNNPEGNLEQLVNDNVRNVNAASVSDPEKHEPEHPQKAAPSQQAESEPETDPNLIFSKDDSNIQNVEKNIQKALVDEEKPAENVPKADTVETDFQEAQGMSNEEYMGPDVENANNAAENTMPQPPQPEVEQKPVEKKPDTLDSPVANENIEEIDDESYFLSYFMVVCVLVVLGYVGYHNRVKVMALMLEGKKNKRHRGRRPNSANYHKLDSNLEEAISSNVTKNANNVIY